MRKQETVDSRQRKNKLYVIQPFRIDKQAVVRGKILNLTDFRSIQCPSSQ